MRESEVRETHTQRRYVVFTKHAVCCHMLISKSEVTKSTPRTFETTILRDLQNDRPWRTHFMGKKKSRLEESAKT